MQIIRNKFIEHSELTSNTIIFLLLSIPLLNFFYMNIYIVAFLYFTTCLLFVISFRYKNKQLVINKIVVLYGLLLLALLIPLNYYTIENFWGNYFSFLLSILIYFIFINSNSDIDIESKILKFVKFSAFILCAQLLFKVFTIVLNNTEPGMYKSTIQIALGNSNSLGFFLLILFFILYETSRQNQKNIVDNLLLILLIISIVTLQSRSTFLAFFVVLIFHLIEKDFRRVLTVFAIFFVTLFSFQFVYTESQGKMVTGYYSEVEDPTEVENSTGIEDSSEKFSEVNQKDSLEENSIYQKIDDISSKRLTLYKNVFNEYQKSPIIGLGLGNVYIDFMGYYGSVRTHNIFLDLLTSSGIIGLLLFSAILFILIMFLWKNKKKNLYICGVFYGLIAILIQGMFEPNIFSYNVDIFLWTLLGACYLIVKNQENVKDIELH